MQDGRGRPMNAVETAMPERPADLTTPPPALAPVPAALAAARERRAADVQATDPRSLQFGDDGTGRLRIDVYDGAGRLVRSIPPNLEMARAMGAQTWQG
jgi:hypothetical protein